MYFRRCRLYAGFGIPPGTFGIPFKFWDPPPGHLGSPRDRFGIPSKFWDPPGQVLGSPTFHETCPGFWEPPLGQILGSLPFLMVFKPCPGTPRDRFWDPYLNFGIPSNLGSAPWNFSPAALKLHCISHYMSNFFACGAKLHCITHYMS